MDGIDFFCTSGERRRVLPSVRACNAKAYIAHLGDGAILLYSLTKSSTL